MTNEERKDDETQGLRAVLADSKKTLTTGAVVGAAAGAVAGVLLTIIILVGLMGSGHGGPLEGTGLAPIAWALVLPGLVLGEELGFGILGWIVGCVLPYGVIGALVGVFVASRRPARSD